VGILPPAPTVDAEAHEHGEHRHPEGHEPAEPEPHHEHRRHEGHEPAEPQSPHDHPGAEAEAGRGDPAMGRAMRFIVRLLEDPEVQRRIHAVHELHEAWEDPAVQRVLERMRRMHGGGHEHH
jgi:hypothetical protein